MSLTPDEIKRELTRFVFDPRYKGKGNRVPLNTFCRYVGISRRHVEDIILGERNIGAKSLTQMGPEIEKIIDGRLKFIRRGLVWEICEKRKDDYAGAGKPEPGSAHKVIYLSKPQLLERIR
jgi:hypothetical protein